MPLKPDPKDGFRWSRHWDMQVLRPARKDTW